MPVIENESLTGDPLQSLGSVTWRTAQVWILGVFPAERERERDRQRESVWELYQELSITWCLGHGLRITILTVLAFNKRTPAPPHSSIGSTEDSVGSVRVCVLSVYFHRAEPLT